MATLREELEAQLAKSNSDPRTNEIRERAIELLRDGGTAPGLQVGDVAPGFTLPDAHGNPVSFGQLLEAGPLVVSFYRGDWCPYCNLELRALERVAPKIRALGGSIVAISPQAPDHALALSEENQLSFPILSDTDQEVSAAYRLRFEVSAELRATMEGRRNDLSVQNANGAWTLPVAATYVVGRDGRVILGQSEVDWRVRLEPAEIVAALSSAGAPE